MRSKIFNKETGIYLLLFLLSFFFYAFYYNHLLLNLNNVLAQPTGDSLKNYYTFAYHIKNDKALLNFSGMNYPFGEHIVYTDCQPILTFVFKLLPFTQGYAIGTMHLLIILSFIITPLILYRIFAYFKVSSGLAFFSSLAIAFLSPQLHRIEGHFGLAYGCTIPLAILFLLRFNQHRGWKKAVGICVFNLILFLVHPYLGLGSSLFCFLCVVITALLSDNKKNMLPATSHAIIAGIAPMLLFSFFLALTDHHTDRTPEPYGADIMDGAAKMESVFTTDFGPFSHFLKRFIHSVYVNWEALSYVGFFPMCLALIGLITLPFYFRKLSYNKELMGLFLSSVVLLIFAFGVHVKVLKILDVRISALNQFRCLGRYAWFFYFMFPVFLITTLSHLQQQIPGMKLRKLLPAFTGLLFLTLNLLEAHPLLTYLTTNRFVSKNIFKESLLDDNEKKMLKVVREQQFSAIVPFPMFHIGSDVYQKNGYKSFLPAVLYSYHAGLPIIGEVLSRTSVEETETAMELLNRYKKIRKIDGLIGDDKLLVLQAGDTLQEDERRVVKTATLLGNYNDLTFYAATKNNFKMSATEKEKFVAIENRSYKEKNIVYVHFENRRPFLSSRIDDYHTMTNLDSNSVKEGDYIVSFHYHMRGKKFRYLFNHLIIEKSAVDYNKWDSYNAIRSTSGFYDSMIVYEQKMRIDPHFKYKFTLRGLSKEYYRISDFMLRPADLDIRMQRGSSVIYNNFPE